MELNKIGTSLLKRFNLSIHKLLGMTAFNIKGVKLTKIDYKEGRKAETGLNIQKRKAEFSNPLYYDHVRRLQNR